jgi:hypothetical protein
MTSSRRHYFHNHCQSSTGDLTMHSPFTSFPAVPLVCSRQVSLLLGWLPTMVYDIGSYLLTCRCCQIQIDGSGNYHEYIEDSYWSFVSLVLRDNFRPGSHEITWRRGCSFSIQGLDTCLHQIGSKHRFDVCLLWGKPFNAHRELFVELSHSTAT